MADTITEKLQTIASNIRAKRLYRNYSQDYLGRKLNISQNAYSKLECGYTKVSFEKLLIIADVLNVDVAELLKMQDKLN